MSGLQDLKPSLSPEFYLLQWTSDRSKRTFDSFYPENYLIAHAALSSQRVVGSAPAIAAAEKMTSLRPLLCLADDPVDSFVPEVTYTSTWPAPDLQDSDPIGISLGLQYLQDF